MKKIMFLLVAVIVCMVTACSKDEAVVNNDENLITELKLYIEGSDTRANYEYVTGVGFKFKWEDGEYVYVYPAEIGNSIVTTFRYKAETETFVLYEGSALVAGNKYYAVTGQTQESGFFNDGKICAAMELNGNGLLGNIPMVSDIFTATAEGTFATFHHMVGIVEIPVKGNIGVYDINLKIDGSTDAMLYGTFTVEFDGDGKASTITKTAGTGKKSMQSTVKYGSSSPLVLSETVQSLFYPALPGEYNKVVIDYAKVGIGAGWTTSELGTLRVQRGKINKKSVPVNIE